MKQATDHSLDELLRALANPCRRRLLRELRERQTTDGRTRVPVTAIQTALDVPERQALIDLHHKHLPTLRAVGLVERPADGETDGGADGGERPVSERDVVPGPQFGRVTPVLDALRQLE